MMNSTMHSDCGSLEDGDLQIELSNSSGFKDGPSPHYDDELMYALDTLEEHANDSIQATRDSELYWLKLLRERDELIETKEQSIEDLQRLNEKLESENQYLLQQVLELNGDINREDMPQKDAVAPGKPDKSCDLTLLNQLRKENSLLFSQLNQSGKVPEKILFQLQNSRQLKDGEIVQLCKQIRHSAALRNSGQDQIALERQISELCELYDSIIVGAVNDCEEHMNALDNMDMANGNHSEKIRNGTTMKGQPAGSTDVEIYYADMLQTLEKSNKELRQQIEQLQKNLTNKEQAMFNDTMARLDNSNKQHVDKLKAQITELSQEMALQNVDNRALRERLLRTEEENEQLSAKLNDSFHVDEEMKSLQENLDSQLGMNQSLEKKIKGLELVKMEHDSICKRTKNELQEASRKVMECERELTDLRKKLREAKDMQLKFDFMNLHLNSKMEKLHNENSVLLETVQKAETSMEAASCETQKIADLESSIAGIEKIKSQQQQQIQELTKKLDESEMQRHNANLKVKALRERLKVMQDSWQKISTDTESSFSALRDQYQQQIKEYKSIIESLKSQNTALSARIESMKKMTDQENISRSGHMSSLEQQITEYKQITEGYREENMLLRKELKNLVAAKQALEDEQMNTSTSTRRMSNSDEFAKLRDILTTAKSEVENLQITKSPRSRTTSAERSSYYQEKERTKQTVQEIQEKYEGLSPDFTASLETTKANDEIRNKYNHHSSSAIQQKPLAESTPRNLRAKTASTNYKSPIRTDHTPPRIMTAGSYKKPYQPIKPFTLSPSKHTTQVDPLRNTAIHEKPPTHEKLYEKLSTLEKSCEKPSTHDKPSTQEKSYDKPIIQDKLSNDKPTTYDKPSNIRSKFPEPESMAQLASSKPKLSTSTLGKTQLVTSAGPSRKKEVVELKHSNSAELDLSRSFKPIEPDDSLQVAQPTYLSSYSSKYKTAYSSPYKTTYGSNDGTYRSSYDVIKPAATVRRPDPISSYSAKLLHSSTDKVYGTKSSQPSIHTSMPHHSTYGREPLPNIASIRSKYSHRLSAQGDSLSKVPPLFTSQSAQLVTAS